MKKTVLMMGFIVAAASTFGAGLIINEYNAVGSEKWLNATTYAGSANVDAYFQALADGQFSAKLTGVLPNGRIQGNGSDWIELIVTQDHLDIRGWQIRWAELAANEANGTDIWYGSGAIEQGILTFSQDPVWSDLRKGTIITLVEEQTLYVDTDNGNSTYNVAPSQAEAIIDMSTDLSFNTADDDWWINVNIQQEMTKADAGDRLVTSIHNVSGHQQWDFGVGNDNWQAQINKADSTLEWGPVGEHLAPTGWGGGGINSTEAARAEKDPSSEITGVDFEDAGTSSFGMPNRWGTPEKVQSFGALRAWYYLPTTCQEALALGFGNPFDVVADCYVNLADLAVFAQNWLKCINPADPNCEKPWLQ
jgi:hypothetical protein